MNHIFISYSKKDIAFARHLRELLEAQGFGVWMDETRLVPAERWWPSIVRNIEMCAAMIVIMSPDARESDWVEREILYAEDLRKPIYPVLFRGRRWPRLANIQYADMTRGLRATLPPDLLDGLRADVPYSDPYDVPPPLDGEMITDEMARPQPKRSARWAISVALLAMSAVALLLALSGALSRDSGRKANDDPASATPIPAGARNADWEPLERESGGVPYMVAPSGCFLMGSEADDAQEEEAPVHEVCLSAFWISKTEVTNAQYRACVEAGDCAAPANTQYLDDDAYEDHPVVYVDWEQANAFAEWAGCRLPTEAQWEYAARGPEGWTYPWGNVAPSCSVANVYGCGGLAAVGRYPDGASWVGAFDMAGNVWEWVADWYDGEFYGKIQQGAWDPIGPVSSSGRVSRGGSGFDHNQDFLRAAARRNSTPSNTNSNQGFRLVCEPDSM